MENFKENIYEKVQKNDDIKNIIDKLSLDISKNFGIDKKNAENLINDETIDSLKTLDENIKKFKNEEVTKEKLDNLLNSINISREIIKNSRNDILSLKNELNKKDKNKYLSEKLLPKQMFEIAKNPNNLHSEIIGGCIGVINSIENITRLTKDLGVGIIKSIPDLISIFNGKGYHEGFERI